MPYHFSVKWDNQVIITDNIEEKIKKDQFDDFFKNPFGRRKLFGIFRIPDPIALGITVKHEYVLPKNFDMTVDRDYDLKIKEFLKKKFLSLPEAQKLPLDDHNLKILYVNGLDGVSGESTVWENIEITLIAGLKNGKLRIDGIFDGDCQNSKNRPTEDALKNGPKLDKVYPEKLRSYGYKLMDELSTVLIK